MKRFFVSFLWAFGAMNPVSASWQSPEDSAVEASRLAIAAWECHVAGEGAEYDADLDRLFQLGFKNGIRFLEAVRAGEVSPEAMHESVPFWWQLVSGPSNDFILGRLYESIHNQILTDLSRENLTSTRAERKLSLAATFERSNCELLRE